MKIEEIIQELINKNAENNVENTDDYLIFTKKDLVPYYYHLTKLDMFEYCTSINLIDEDEYDGPEPHKYYPNDSIGNYGSKTIKLGDGIKFVGDLYIECIRLTAPLYMPNGIFDIPDNNGYFTPAFYHPHNFAPWKKIIVYLNLEEISDLKRGGMSEKEVKKSLVDKFKDILNNPDEYKCPQYRSLELTGFYKNKNTEKVTPIHVITP